MLKIYNMFIYLFLLMSVSVTFNAFARDNETDLNIIGNILIPPPCKINQGGNVDVKFGQVAIKSIKGTEQKKEVNYQIECGKNQNNWKMYLSVNGTKSNFDTNGLKTNINDLAVKFQLGNNIIDLGTKYAIDEKSPGKLWAILVKKENSTLPTGDFVANGTLLVEYQ